MSAQQKMLLKLQYNQEKQSPFGYNPFKHLPKEPVAHHGLHPAFGHCDRLPVPCWTFLTAFGRFFKRLPCAEESLDGVGLICFLALA